MSSELIKDFNVDEPVMDSIYGVIKISLFEKALISTKEMQRLRGIKQLGFVNLVYPDAEHSRFAHSLGVCHQAKMLIEQVKNNIKNITKFQDWRNKYAKDLNPKHVQTSDRDAITNIERIVISAAALLHDLPHSPFSHEMETHGESDMGIPVHDNYAKNPIFFNYLFDYNSSDLAKLLKIYNIGFWELVKKDEKWNEILLNNSEIDNEGYVKIASQVTSDSVLVLKSGVRFLEKLPILGVMIFEILLFDKCKMWVHYKQHKITPNEDGCEVVINFKKSKLLWKPIKNWFRPYRKDIVANTICADLLDYLLRDGRNTGILSALDLKFFDRMTIVKAFPDKTDTLIDLVELPNFCEHIVFDIFDHKRGVIRQSIITEILAFLQQRYLLAERVYQHRVVEGARTMLQEIARLLTSTELVGIQHLHNSDNLDFAPASDEAFLAWVLNLKENEILAVKKAKHLVKMLKERRIFRESVIIDADHDLHKGTFRGLEVDCKTLANMLLDDEKRQKVIDKLNGEITKLCVKYEIEGYPDYKNEQIFTIGVREYGKGYKIPRVLVCRPLNNSDLNKIEVFPLFDAKKIPAMSYRLESMQKAYNSLWKVYLFIHPFFHSNEEEFIKIHDEIAKIFLKQIYDETHILWNNSIEHYNDLLPEKPIDILSFIKEYELNARIKISNKLFISKLINQINQSIDDDQFKLNTKNDRENIINRIIKLGNGPEILADKSLQSKIIKQMVYYKPKIEGKAASEGRELIIKQILDEIKKISKSGDTII